MADPFVAEIRIFAFNFPPKGWAFCNGQLLPLSQNTALFSLLGTTYGGDGKSTFALPDMQGNVPMHPGQGPGLSLHDLGETSGTPFVTLLASEMPAHLHNVGRGKADAGDSVTPVGSVWAQSGAGRGAAALYHTPANAKVNVNSLSPTGGSLPHNNMQPYLTLNFCIALQGVFPTRP
jgi:microcystin-dependent protein